MDVTGADLVKPIGSGTRSCGCQRRDNSRKRPYEYIFNLLVRVANGRGMMTMSYEEFLVFTAVPECHYCGVAIVWNQHNITGRVTCRYNLDRKDNEVGYTKENCVVCCKECNIVKGDRFTYEQFLQIGAVIRTFRCSA